MNFKINQVVYDSENKEYVKITNGIENDGIFKATEGIVYRLFGLVEGKPVIAFTYRKVNDDKLRNIEAVPNYFNQINFGQDGYDFIGRV